MIRPARHVVIRAAHKEDAARLHHLQASIYDEGTGFVGDGAPSLEALERKLKSFDPDLSCILVALDSGSGEQRELCGWLELHRLVPRRLRHVAVLTLAVAPAARRRGVARALLAGAYRWAERVGVGKLSLNVRSSNDAAVRLYAREGFVEEGRERDHIRVESGFEDNLIMAKFLGGSRG